MTRAPTAMYHDDDQIVTDIRSLLEHGYHKESFLREMMQNADDAGASGLHIIFRPEGLGPTAKNPLLNGPLLLIANNGELTVSDEDALYKATGGNKAGDEAKVGRFGLGLKSIFHWCEAFVYCAVTDGEQPRAGVVNPYVRSDGRDPCNSEWQDIKDDLPLLEKTLHSLLRDDLGASTGLLFCAPLRTKEHLNRGDLRLHDWEWPEQWRSVPTLFDLEAAEAGQGRPRPLLPELVLVLAQCGQLDRVSAEWPGGGFTVARRASPHVARLGRHKLAGEAVDLPDLTSDLRSTIDVSAVGAASWTVEVFGAERTAPHGSELRQDPAWPKDMVARRHEPGKSDKQARKALGHGAVTLVKWPNVPALPSRVAVRWAAFLPLETAYHVDHQSGLARQQAAPSPLDVVLHGYFFPKPDRKGLEGLTAAGDSIASKWNRSVARDLTLPLVPAVLAAAAPQATPETRDLIVAAAQSLAALNVESAEVISTTLLVPVIGSSGTAYRAIDRGEIGRFRRVHGWQEVSGITWLRRAILDFARAANVELVQEEFIVRAFLPMPLPWQANEFVAFLAAIQVPDEEKPDRIGHVLDVVEQTFPRPADLGQKDIVGQAALGWLQRLQSNGWGPYGRKWPGDDFGSQAAKDLLDWLAKCGALAVNVSVGARPAVERLAADAILGVVLVPCGAQASSGRDSRVVDACAAVLPGLVERIADAEKPQRANRAIGPKAWKLLARDLVRLVGMERVRSDPTLMGLALIPTWQPARKGETLLSAAVLATKAKASLVFTAPVGDDDADSQGSVAAALKKPAEDWMKALASALAVSAESLCVVQVDGNDFASIDLDSISRSVCANAVSLHGDFERRKSLFEALCSDHAFNPDRRRAARLLAHGQASHTTSDDLLYVLPDDGSLRVAATAYLRQRQEGWRIVDGTVRSYTTGEDRKALGVSELSESAFLDRLRKEPAGVSPDGLSDEERLALLHVVATSRDKELFFALPMHAARRDARGAIAYSPLKDGRTFRSGIDIPAEIATGVTIIADVVDGRAQAAYAEWLREFDVRSLLEVLLMQDASHKHWQLILTTLRRPTGVLSPLAPAFADLAGDLNQVAWLPTGTHGGVAPVDVVDDLACGDEVRKLLGELLRDCNARSPILASALAVTDMDAVGDFIGHLNNRRNPLAALRSNLERHRINISGAWALGPTSWAVQTPEFQALLRCEPLASERKAWRLLRAGSFDQAASGTDQDGLAGLAGQLRGTMHAEDWVATLNALVLEAGMPESAGLRDAWFAFAGSVPRDEIIKILAKLKVLCADGKWRGASLVSACLLGVPEKSSPHNRTAQWLKLGDDPVIFQNAMVVDATSRILAPQEVCTTIERWVGGTVQRPVLGAVFCLTGSPALEAVAQEWLGDKDIKAMRAELGVVPDPFGSVDQVRFFLSSSKATQARVPGLCGGHVVVDSERNIDELLEGEPRRQLVKRSLEEILQNPPGVKLQHLDIVLRACDFSRLDSATRKEVLKRTAAAFARAVLGEVRFRQAPFERWWKRYGEGSQAAILPVRAMLLDELPAELERLRVRDVPDLARLNLIVNDIRNLKLARHDAAGSRAIEVDKGLRQKHQDLEGHFGDSVVADALRQLVRKQLSKYGYSASSVLLELIQNADDALEQLAEMRQTPLPTEARTIRIRLKETGGSKGELLTFTHWGRLINDHGGASFPQGRAQQWDQDLYFMLRFQVSGKVGADAASEAVQSTGQFGLGFKSVHLVSDNPRIQSGDLAFCIEAGLLPREVKGDQIGDRDSEIGTLMPTHIELPLAAGIAAKKLASEIFGRLAPIAGLLPAMSRQVLSLDLPADQGGVISADSNLIPFAEGWTISKAAVHIGEKRAHYKLLRFRAVDGRSLRTVVVGLVAGIPAPLPPDIPTFWVVAPTQESWEVGYAVNGDFKLDTGRVRVAFDSSETKSETLRCGQDFGTALVGLVTAVRDHAAARDVLGVADPEPFLGALWRTLARGLDGKKSKAEEHVLVDLHGESRGLGLLTRSLAAVPSGMPAPWPQLVGPIAPGDQVCVASNAALAPAVQPLFESIPELRGARVVVAKDIAEPLKRIAQVQTGEFNVVKQLQTWSAKLRDEVTPEIAEKLHPLASDDCWDAIDREVDGHPGPEPLLRSWAKGLKFRSADGGMREVKTLLLPSEAASKAKELSCAKDTLADEMLRSAFAPINAVLWAEYAKSPRALDVFLRVRGELSADAAKLAKWAAAADTTAKQRAAAIYLGRGSLREKVAGSVRDGGQPLPWAEDRATWQRVAMDAGLDDRENQKAEIDLFGTLTSSEPATPPPLPPQSPTMSKAEAVERLSSLWKIWGDPAYRERRLDERRTALWPRTWERAKVTRWLLGDFGNADTRKAWIVLFLLAHVQGLGLGGRDGVQHRGFVESLLSRRSRVPDLTWWDRLFGVDAPDGTWPDFLDEWSRTRLEGARPYGFWMRVLPDMYAATKWWREYAQALKRGKVNKGSFALLAPAANPDLAGDYDSADVPAMVGAMKRLPWMLSELEYYQVIPERHEGIDPKDGFTPTPELTNVLKALGFFGEQEYRSYKSGEVFAWISDLIGADRAQFHGLYATVLEVDAETLLRR
jgi:hypothetical protein